MRHQSELMLLRSSVLWCSSCTSMHTCRQAAPVVWSGSRVGNLHYCPLVTTMHLIPGLFMLHHPSPPANISITCHTTHAQGTWSASVYACAVFILEVFLFGLSSKLAVSLIMEEYWGVSMIHGVRRGICLPYRTIPYPSLANHTLSYGTKPYSTIRYQTIQ